MSSSHPARRRLLLGVAAGFVFAIVALTIGAGFALWRLTAWGTTALDEVTDATVAAVEPLQQDAVRALQESKGAVATTMAAFVLDKEQAIRRLGDAEAVVSDAEARIAQALGDPSAALRDATHDVAEEASRALVAAAAAVHGAGSAVSPGEDASASRKPEAWPEGHALRQVHYRRVGDAAEFRYVADAPGFRLDPLRQQLIEAGYEEDVISEREGSLEAVYRGERALLLSVTLRGDRTHIDVREVPLVRGDRHGP
jgi:hypothetical protein